MENAASLSEASLCFVVRRSVSLEDLARISFVARLNRRQNHRNEHAVGITELFFVIRFLCDLLLPFRGVDLTSLYPQ